ncbi:MAG TPA: septum formation initiator family protein [Candidatus Paceibacterota bacterium]
MREFQNHNHWQRVMASRSLQIFLLLILVLIGQSVVQFYQRERAVAAEEMVLRSELLALTVRRDELTAEVASLGTERGIEGEIRERFGVVKEGEKVINLISESAPTVAPTTTVSWWQKIVSWFN